ncbi:MAG: DUF814 domain-containing protein [Bacteroidia bacterium]|nr:DUF814 domain-containing protein [Bacteroidia bacterium]
MNHLNALLLESIALNLNERIHLNKVLDCFSNSQDEFIIEFQDFHIKCLFYKGEVFFFFNSDSPSKSRLFKPQFSEIKDLNVAKIVAHPFERSFHIEFNTNLKLLFKCYGRKSNILLFENNATIDHFRKHLEADSNLQFSELIRQIHIDFNAPISNFKKQFPFLPSEFEILPELNNPNSFKLLIDQYRHLNGVQFDSESLELFATNSGQLLEDVSRFSAHAIRQYYFNDKRQQLLQDCLNQISEKENFIASNEKAILQLKNKRPDGEIGHIILANLHLLKSGLKSAEIFDIYNSTPIKVNLDENLSPVENAERYFKKEKAIPFNIKLLESKVEKAKIKRDELKIKLQNIQSANNAKSLKPLLKKEEISQKEEHLPYRKFHFQGYDILVGKHAESNEKLLNYFSDKNDIWLHARDVSGSHVIIKVKGQLEVPLAILEHAASIAAYYSKNRNQNLATVRYTLRKFVRKIKGAEKGKVTISNDKSLLVKPSKGHTIS